MTGYFIDFLASQHVKNNRQFMEEFGNSLSPVPRTKFEAVLAKFCIIQVAYLLTNCPWTPWIALDFVEVFSTAENQWCRYSMNPYESRYPPLRLFLLSELSPCYVHIDPFNILPLLLIAPVEAYCCLSFPQIGRTFCACRFACLFVLSSR